MSLCYKVCLKALLCLNLDGVQTTVIKGGYLLSRKTSLYHAVNIFTIYRPIYYRTQPIHTDINNFCILQLTVPFPSCQQLGNFVFATQINLKKKLLFELAKLTSFLCVLVQLSSQDSFVCILAELTFQDSFVCILAKESFVCILAKISFLALCGNLCTCAGLFAAQCVCIYRQKILF